MNATHTDLLRFIRSVKAKQASGAQSDRQLLEAFLNQRSESSFTALVQRHGAMVFSVCRRLLRHTHDAEDAFQATFLTLARRAASIRRHESLGSWLHGVAYHVAATMKRAVARRVVHEGRLSPPPPADVMDDITWRELRSALDEELQRLPEKYRAPLVLCYLEARTQDEAARRLGWSKCTFGRRMNQARQLLAQRLTRRGLTLPAALTAPLLIDGAAQAAVPPLLAANTVRAGLAMAMGNTVRGMVSAQAAALAEGGVASLLAKRTSIAVVLLASLTLGIGGLLVPRAIQNRTFAGAADAPKPPPPPARSSSEDKAIEIAGCVLGPDDKPAAGARLLLFSWSEDKDDFKVSATTGEDGRFRFSVPAGAVRRGAKLVALARGFGPDWVWIDGRKNAGNITLRLVPDDVPIAGRVLDLEGLPVSGVSVGISWVDDVDLKSWLADPKPVDLFGRKTKNIRPAALGVPLSVTTDKDGRFRLTGFGRDRIAHLRIRGAGIENNDIEVMARTGNLHGLRLESRTVYASGSTIVVRPSKPIVGTVRDKKTGKPIAGITVFHPDGNYDWARAKTDDKGRYRIEGVSKRKDYSVAAGGLPYFNMTKMHIADTLGLDPLPVNFELERGLVVKGRLRDGVTGKPVRGCVAYGPAPDNPNLKDFSAFGRPQFHMVDPGRTDADGSFTVVAIPGRGTLTARADDGDAYAVAPQGGIPQNHIAVPIDVPATGEQPIVHNLTLTRARARTGRVVGPDDQPLTGVYAAGLHALWQFGRGAEQLKNASIQIHGFLPKETRVIVVVDPAKRLARVQKVVAEEREPFTVRLEPMGTLAGRVHDKEGHPMPGLKVKASYRFQEAEQARSAGRDYRDLPPELLYDYPKWDKIINRETTTDKDGRFRIEGLVPGIEYDLAVRDGQTTVVNQEHLSVQSGKVNDLGDLKNKPAPEKGAEENP